MWGTGTELSVEDCDTLHSLVGRGHLTPAPMLAEDV